MNLQEKFRGATTRKVDRSAEGQPGRRRGRVVAVLVTVLVVWVVLVTVNMLRQGHVFAVKPPGDGVHVDSYGFDLSNLTVRRDLLVASGFARDAVKALTDPAVLTVEQMEQMNRRLRQMHKGKFIVPGDRVIGVVLEGQARAYPLRFLYWHEVVNDRLAGRPIAVTYHGLCDSAVVFDRRVGGRVLEFGVSGLLYNSNQLLYDRPGGGPGQERPSLWSQLLMRPIAGPAVERGWELQPVEMQMTTWDRWRSMHPQTTILRGVDAYFDSHYKKQPFARYWEKQQTIFPIAPQVPADSPIRPFEVVRPMGGRVHCFYFAWYAMHGTEGL